MNINRLVTVAAGLALAVGVVACDNNMTGINQDPNNPATAPAGPVFTYAVQQAVGRFLGSGYDLRGTEFVTQHLAEVQYPDEDRYARLQGPQTATYFNRAYSRELEDLSKVIGQGKEKNYPGLYEPALILQTWVYGYLTDTWGDVPYSQALAGDSTIEGLAPAYDTQQDIYKGFFATLDSASAALADAENKLGDADPIYGGDPAMWQKFANSLHARYALRIVNKDPATASAELAAAFAADGGLIESNADNAMLRWPGDGVSDNPWGDNFKSRDDHRMSRTLMDIMNANQDPRVPVFAQPTQADATKYAGMPNGLQDSDANTYSKTTSRPGAIFWPRTGGTSQPSYLMTAAEVLFIEAEAAERSLGGLTPSQAKGFYDDAIRASMEQWGITDADVIATYLGQPNVAFKGNGAGDASDEGLKQIAVQKWIALFTDGGQAWAEWRRTCQPATLLAGPAAIVKFIPRRFEYSQTEYSVNKANLDAAIADQGPDEFGTRIWWDSNPTAAPTYDATKCNDPEHPRS